MTWKLPPKKTVAVKPHLLRETLAASHRCFCGSVVSRFGLAVRCWAGKWTVVPLPIRLASRRRRFHSLLQLSFLKLCFMDTFLWLPLAFNKTLIKQNSLVFTTAHLNAESFWWCQCSVRFDPPRDLSLCQYIFERTTWWEVVLIYHWWKLPQVYFLSRQTRLLSWQNFCHNKFCYDKHTFVRTNMCVKTNVFVVTKLS